MQHISVGDLLRRIKNNNTDPQAEVLAYMLNKQELIDGKVLVPILKTELEELESRDRRKRGILVDGFPRNLEQLRQFEAASILSNNLIAILCYVFTNAASSLQNPNSFYFSTVPRKSRGSDISRETWKGERRMMRQCSRNDIRST